VLVEAGDGVVAGDQARAMGDVVGFGRDDGGGDSARGERTDEPEAVHVATDHDRPRRAR
jgi:hypothetical protein